ncbi:MAG: GWxTD domain-containing protein [Candidatus Aminicenantales bacterium]
MRKIAIGILVLALMGPVVVSCRSFRLEKGLSPEHEEFLSKVRYIITKKERKVFLNLPPSEREAFIQEFWKKRDPDPETEVNEFKETYYSRIEEANHLFREGGTPGWLQDRGRIYILLGPPEGREKYPTGYTFYGRPIEVWYYGPYPILFVDKSYVGDYELDPGSAQHLANLLKASEDLKPKVKTGKTLFDFDLNLSKTPGRIRLQIRVPYESLWLVEKEEFLETTLVLHVEVETQAGKRVWEHDEEYPVSLAQEEAERLGGGGYTITVENDLPPGRYRMSITLTNTADGQKIKKVLVFKME